MQTRLYEPGLEPGQSGSANLVRTRTWFLANLVFREPGPNQVLANLVANLAREPGPSGSTRFSLISGIREPGVANLAEPGFANLIANPNLVRTWPGVNLVREPGANLIGPRREPGPN